MLLAKELAVLLQPGLLSIHLQQCSASEALLTERNPKEHFSSITDSVRGICCKAVHIVIKHKHKQWNMLHAHGLSQRHALVRREQCYAHLVTENIQLQPMMIAT